MIRAQTGAVTRIHDPSIIQSNGVFYLFSTGRGVNVHTSTDLFTWKRETSIFSQSPDWARTYIPANGSMWAPDISFMNGEYRLYYAVSSFGKTSSAIGLATNKSLDPSSPDYRWTDRRIVVQTPADNNWNAIDPCAFADANGNAWLVLGSCWTGIKLISLDRKTGLQTDIHQPPIWLAANPPTNLIEEGYIRSHGGFCYLWVSDEHCCRGADSTYCIKVGRSKDVTGPYIDRDGKPMLRGGGTLVLAGYGDVRGPGSSAIIPFDKREFLIHHEYDAANFGMPTLQVRPLFWAEDGWPVVGDPIVRSPAQSTPTPKSPAGDWLIRRDYGSSSKLALGDDHTLSPDVGHWRNDGKSLILKWNKAARTISVLCTLSDDGSCFVGRDSDGVILCGTRKPQ